MVVAKQGHSTTMLRSAGQIGVPEHIARPVSPGAFAIPVPDDAVELSLTGKMRLLSAPARRGGQVFIDTGLKHDVMGFQVLASLPKGGIEGTERRTPVARNEACGPKALPGIATLLGQCQADQGLHAIHVGMPLVAEVLIIE